MKCLLINLLVFIIAVSSDTGKRLFLPNLPVGQYRLSFLGMMNCVSIPSNDKIQFGLYLSKKSANTTEIRGNVTNFIPLDDSLSLEFNMAIKDSIGGWKDKAYIFKAPKACSSLKFLLGSAWSQITDSLGMHNVTCPIPVGVYKAKGMDTDLSKFVNFPKTFFYGTYKFRFYYSKNDVVYGCLVMVIQVKRSWETD